MVILEKPYVSTEIAAWLARTGVPVLDNDTARQLPAPAPLRLVGDAEFARLVDAGKRLYTTNENALDWVYAHIHNEPLLHAISLMKDKAALRRALQPAYPDYRFSEMTLEKAKKHNPETLPYPFVLKPSVGFFSIGVYLITTPDEWRNALADIAGNRQAWGKTYSEEVVGNDLFLLEDVIEGDEYAIDAYFDENGQPVIVNILRHEFASADDVSDRLYHTSSDVLHDTLDRFGQWLAEANVYLGIRDFPVHAEVRTQGKSIMPIEFNPLRFAGLCTTDISYFAYDFFTYDCYLNNRRPDWDKIMRDKPDDTYAMIILDKPKSGVEGKKFDYQALAGKFSHVLSLREYHGAALPVFGFLFARVPSGRRGELDSIMQSDLREFLQ